MLAWTAHTYLCGMCRKAIEGSNLQIDDTAAVFEMPPGWFFCRVTGGLAMCCSIECARQALVRWVGSAAAAVWTRRAWKVTCKGCQEEALGTRMDGPSREALVAPPLGFTGFLVSAEDDDLFSDIHLTCSRSCAVDHLHALVKDMPSPPPPLRVV